MGPKIRSCIFYRKSLYCEFEVHKFYNMAGFSDKIEEAINFLLHPDVVQMPYQAKFEFLLGKGLSGEEIGRAYADASIRSQKGASTWSNVANNAAALVILGGACYAGYQCTKKFYNWFHNIDEREEERLERIRILNSLQEIRGTLQQMDNRLLPLESRVSVMDQQWNRDKQNMDKGYKELKTHLESLRSMMLSSKSFAPLPPPSQFLSSLSNTTSSSYAVRKIDPLTVISPTVTLPSLNPPILRLAAPFAKDTNASSSICLPSWQREQKLVVAPTSTVDLHPGTPEVQQIPSVKDVDSNQQESDDPSSNVSPTTATKEQSSDHLVDPSAESADSD